MTAKPSSQAASITAATPNEVEIGRGERARERLIDAAVEIFSQSNLEGARTREIAAAADQNVASISYYFGSKEALYHAVFYRIAEDMRLGLGEILDDINRTYAEGTLTKGQALAKMKHLMRMLYLFVRKKDSQGTGAVGRLIVREQITPTAAFDILYNNAIKLVHEASGQLVATMMDADPREPLVIIRTHALLGQMFGFITARETIRRRLGIGALGTISPEVEASAREAVARVLEEHTEVLLLGLAILSGSSGSSDVLTLKQRLSELDAVSPSPSQTQSQSIVNVEHFP